MLSNWNKLGWKNNNKLARGATQHVAVAWDMHVMGTFKGLRHTSDYYGQCNYTLTVRMINKFGA